MSEISEVKKVGKASTAGSKVTPGTVAVYVVLIIWALLCLFPVYWMLTFSLKTTGEIFGQNVIDYNKYGIVGTPIMVRGAYQQRFNSDIKFNVQSISLLEDVKGKVVHNILIHINDDELEKAKVITPFMTASTENRCDLYFRVQDVDHQRFVDLKSKAKIPVSKKLLDTLDEANIRYKINADF